MSAPRLLTECYHSDLPLSELHHQHRHREHQLLYVSQGCMTCEIAGHRYLCPAPTLVFIGNWESHAILSASDPYVRSVLTIDPTALAQAMPPILESVFTCRPAGFSHILHLPQKEALISELLQAIHRAYRTPPSSELPEEPTLLLAALLCALRQISPTHFSSQSVGPNERIAAAVRSRLEGDCSTPLDLSGLAAEHHVSRSHLSHLFKRAYGISLREYLTLIRMEKACSLLSTTQIAVGQIAEACGFRDMSNFSRCFWKAFGLSPTAYRARKQKTPRDPH